MGINPDSGQYRLSGEVAGVELNELRKTLAIRPTPYSVGGAVRGVLHVSGPLDQPIFSGPHVIAYHLCCSTQNACTSACCAVVFPILQGHLCIDNVPPVKLTI